MWSDKFTKEQTKHLENVSTEILRRAKEALIVLDIYDKTIIPDKVDTKKDREYCKSIIRILTSH